MARGRKGTPVTPSADGVQVVEAPGAFSAAQATKAKRPKPRFLKPSLDGKTSKDDAIAGRKRPRAPEWEREYQQIWKSVNELGAEQFTGKAKKAYEARKIVERGGRAPAEVRMPYVMLQGIRKKAKQRAERQAAMEAEAGVVTGKVVGSARRASSNANRASRSGGERGAGSGSAGPAPSMGMMKSGVLHISRNTAPAGVRKRMSEQTRSGGGKGRSGGQGGGRKGGRG